MMYLRKLELKYVKRTAFSFSIFTMLLGQNSLAGKITNIENNNPISDVNILIPELNIGAATDNNGFFKINIPSNIKNFNLEISAVGFAKVIQKITMRKDIDILYVELSPEILKMNPIVVLKNLSRIDTPFLRTPGSSDVVSSIELKSFNDNDINRIISRIPGVYIQEEDGFGLRPNIGMRGTGVERSSKINIMEDGVPISPAPYSSPAAYYSPTAGRMHAIEARKGASQIKYGPNSTGGSLNYVSTPIPEKFKTIMNFKTGNFNSKTIKASIGSNNGKFGYLFETFYDKNDGFKKIDLNSSNTGYTKLDFLGKLRYSSKIYGKFFNASELKLSSTSEVSNETYLGLTQQDFEVNPYRRYNSSQKDKMIADHLQVTFSNSIRLNDNFNLSFISYNNIFNRNWYKLSKINEASIGSILNEGNDHKYYKFLTSIDTPENIYKIKANNRDYISNGIQFVANIKYNLFVNHFIKIGFRKHNDEMDRFQKLDNYKMSSGSLVLNDRGEWGVGSKNNRLDRASSKSIFVEDQFAYKNLTVTTGFRNESIEIERKDWNLDVTDSGLSWNDPDRTLSPKIKNKSINILVPGVSFNYELLPNINTIIGFHKGFSPPGPGSNQSDNVKPEESLNTEFGASISSGLNSFKTIFFINDYKNLLGSDTEFAGLGTYDQFNAGKVYIRGLELSFTNKILIKEFIIPFQLSYTLTTTEFKSSFESDYEPWGTVEEGFELPYLPKHQLFIESGLSYSKLDFNIRLKNSSRMRTIAGKGDLDKNFSTDEIRLIDFFGLYKINNSLNFFFSLSNLTDTKSVVSRRPAGLRSSLPRSINFGIRFDS